MMTEATIEEAKKKMAKVKELMELSGKGYRESQELNEKSHRQYKQAIELRRQAEEMLLGPRIGEIG